MVLIEHLRGSDKQVNGKFTMDVTLDMNIKCFVMVGSGVKAVCWVACRG